LHPNPVHSDHVAYIKRDVLLPQILPEDSVTVTVEIDVFEKNNSATTPDDAAEIDDPQHGIKMVMYLKSF
jgi:hypothetical protein